MQFDSRAKGAVRFRQFGTSSELVPNQREGTAWLSVAQAARQEGVTERAVLKRIRLGRVQARREGRRWLVLDHSRPEQITVPTAPAPDGAGIPVAPRTGSLPKAGGRPAPGGRLPPVPTTQTGKRDRERDRERSVQSLSAWQVCAEAPGPLLGGLETTSGLRRRLADQALVCFEELCRGYHAFHYRDKAACYRSARAALCSAAAFALLSGDQALASTIEAGPISAMGALIRSMEKKDGRRAET